ncbi:MAG: hypothetical protein HY319_16180 [Armatimonadetes bacterium]|nr:hypothetical protein [Armatimonadota bacterium]
MAIFLFMAWFVEAAHKLGLIPGEPKDPEGRAYRQAGVVLQALRTELAGARFRDCFPDRLRYEKDQPLEWQEGDHLVVMPTGRQIGELGPGGRVRFTWCPPQGLEVTLTARAEEASHELTAWFRLEAPDG